MTDWSLSGTYFETCNCEAACPCVFLSPPTQGDCTVLVVIDKGHYGDTVLDGLNVALAVFRPAPWSRPMESRGLFRRKGKTTLCTRSSAARPEATRPYWPRRREKRADALPHRWQGQQPVDPGIAEAEIERIEGRGDRPITIDNHPLCIAPGKPAVAARSKRFSLKDFGWEWTLSGRNGFISDFEYAATT
jgi:hypothetical protein